FLFLPMVRLTPTAPLFPYTTLFRSDGRRVGKFLVQSKVKLFPGDFSRQPTQRSVGDLVLREQPRAGRNLLGEERPEIIDAIAGQGRHHERTNEAEPVVQPPGRLEEH